MQHFSGGKSVIPVRLYIICGFQNILQPIAARRNVIRSQDKAICYCAFDFWKLYMFIAFDFSIYMLIFAFDKQKICT